MLAQDLSYPRILITGDIAMYIESLDFLLKVLAKTNRKAVRDGFWSEALIFGEDDVARVVAIGFEKRPGLLGLFSRGVCQANFSLLPGGVDVELVKKGLRRWIKGWVEEGDPHYSTELSSKIDGAGSMREIFHVMANRSR